MQAGSQESVWTADQASNSEKMRKLDKLYAAMKEQKWDLITDLVWLMDFYEFALGRRIMRRFREVRFIKFYARLRRLGKGL